MRIVLGMTVVAACALAGCSNNNDKTDGGANDLGAADLLTVDLGQPPVLTGTNVAPGAGVGVIGLTSDDLIVFADSKGAVRAVPLAGGQPANVDTGVGSARIRGKAVFTWSSYDQQANLGALSVYTTANGPVPLADGSIGRSSAASPDGQYIAWTGNVDTTGTTASIFVGKPDGSVKMEAVKGRSTDPSCLPTMAWWKDIFVVVSCGDAGDAGVAPATIHLIDPQTFAVTEFVTGGTPFFSLDDAGSMLFTIDMAGNGLVKQRGQTTSTVIDSAVSDGFITKDGLSVVYVTTGGALKRWTATTKTTLVASNFTGFLSVSPSQAFTIFYNQYNQDTQLDDVFLASTTAENQTPSTLVADATGSVYGDPFTADEKFALYFSDVDTNDYAGTLNAFGTGGGGQKRELAQRVWFAYQAGNSRVAYNDNFMATSTAGYADLKVVDLAGTAAPTVIATHADPDFFVTSARDKVVFSVQTKGKEGIYVAPLP